LNTTTAGARRFRLDVTLGGAISGNTAASGPVAPFSGNPAGSTTSVQFQWKNRTSLDGGVPGFPALAGTERAPGIVRIARGVAAGQSGGDNLGAQTGSIDPGNDGTGPG